MSAALAFRSCPVARTLQTRKSTKGTNNVSALQRRRAVRVAAVQQQDSNTETRTPESSLSALQSLQKSYDRFMVKYENSILSAGVGALMVTTYCVLNGQSPVEAAGITVCATLVALVSFCAMLLTYKANVRARSATTVQVYQWE